MMGKITKTSKEVVFQELQRNTKEKISENITETPPHPFVISKNQETLASLSTSSW